MRGQADLRLLPPHLLHRPTCRRHCHLLQLREKQAGQEERMEESGAIDRFDRKIMALLQLQKGEHEGC